ncbi:GumC family protein [Nonlabens ulvanivorans]|uniref:non-specific protein-tyrosine kinase n=1 Tax=Nonlabens ulvanivorans TaxID=906888 RepID=A0A084JVZ4_NONUL|nr:tyrosine-protein kinase family protein [Nonlabens ulvanivorans]KEZ93128.1 tyrosine protein kinase [Nonlabens ulvanivorans]PRX13752.1 capsular exopolysaccharide synthesis family protein [Nonlabens ulvanivorans]
MNNQDNKTSEQSLRDQLKPFIKAWPWIILSVLFCVVASQLYLRYATKKYQATASIIIKDTQMGGGLSETGVLGDMGLFGSNFNSVENEIEILKSKRLLSNVIDQFNLTTTYSRKGNVKESDVYNNRFLDVNILKKDSLIQFTKPITFYVKEVSDSLFGLRLNSDSKWLTKEYGEIINIEDLSLIFSPLSFHVSQDDAQELSDLKIVINPKELVVQSYHSRLNVNTSGKRGSVVNLSITDVVGERAEDVLNQLIEEYNKDAINDKNIVALNTAEFIEERLNDITKDLDSVETGIESFKTNKGLTDIGVETSLDLQKVNEIESELLKVETQLSIGRSLKEFMITDIEKSVTTSGLGLNEPQLIALINNYNEVLTTYQRIGQTSTQESPVMLRLSNELSSLKRGIFSSLDSYINGLKVEQNNLLRKSNQINANISQVPNNEKTSRSVERNREVVEAIYLLLREKQETTAISLAVTAPKAKIVDSGYAPDTPVSPKPKIILLAALVLGVLIPLGLVYLKQIFYNKIESRKDLERNLPQVSILGEVPKLESDAKDRIIPNDRSVLAESFRIIRTNLQYKLGALNHDDTKVVLVTSTVKGEGKTTTAFNLASTFAYSGKKVLLIGGDIRNPQLHRFFDASLKRKKGVTEYLVNSDLKLEDLVVPVDDNSNLHMLLSGSIPPNPAELWMQSRTKDMIEEAKGMFDLVIIDSAPTIVVTDTFLINKFADVTVYVTRANHTDRGLLEFISDTIKDGKLTNVAAVINSVKLTNFGYGNKYGYSYSADKKTFMEKLKAKLNF